MESRQAQRAAGGEPGRTWTSGLSVDGFACVRAAGFEPVGQVMGASVYSFDAGLGIRYEPPRAGKVRVIDCPADQVLHAARRAAMRAMVIECRSLGGDGIIGVQVEIGPFQGEERTRAFQIRGTAVRAQGGVRSPKPFSSHLSAQEFAKLIEAGWVPVCLVLGASMLTVYDRHKVRWQARRLAPSREIEWTNLFALVRGDAERMLRDEAAVVGADGVLISGIAVQEHHVKGGRYVEALAIGTAIAAFGPSSRPHEWTQLEKLLPALRTPPRPPAVRPNSIIRLSADEPH